ncbi:cytochrome P450 [Auriscalpium vulgare]|uniref:Cytochrome P450 n=1 Tax=Auriscalpium vulgare TaxID=40419 RepID=A0ACB8S6V5_9AGAM|nr:cytochrome P450 [Auriscalpium vulgare]
MHCAASWPHTWQRIIRHRRPFPPGPKGLPIVGNLFDVPSKASWIRYEEWKKRYGEIISLNIMGQVIVILQSHRTARDLLDKRAGMYADRPYMPFFELAGWQWILPTARVGEAWRAGRRMLDRRLRQVAALEYRPMIAMKSLQFIVGLLDQPDNLVSLIEHLQGAIIMDLTYGYEVRGRDDEFLDSARRFGRETQAVLMPGALLVTDVPFLRHLPEWLPGMSFIQRARDGYELGQTTIWGPWRFFQAAVQNGTAHTSMALRESQEQEISFSSREESDLVEALGSMYIAGVDTTVSSLRSFFLMLVLHPEVQEKARAEILSVTGGTRLPDHSDRSDLPYTEALCKELFRWKPVLPLGLPHSTTEDDIYEGYFIPKGSIVLANLWAILHDPSIYPDPKVFRPERFLGAGGEFKEDPLLNVFFGFGKRLCPGRFIVDSTLFSVVSLVLSTLTVLKAKDVDGNDILVKDENTGDMISHPEPFKCSIVSRGPGAESLIIERLKSSTKQSSAP